MLYFIRLLLAFITIWAGQCHAVVFVGDRVQVKDELKIYPLGDFKAPLDRILMDEALTRRDPVTSVSDNKPRYLYTMELSNFGAQREILVEISGSIVDEIDLYVFDSKEIVFFGATGYFYPREAQSYTFNIPIPKGQTYLLVFEIKSRYFSGPVNFYFENPDDYLERSSDFLALVYVCLGGMIFLGLYNLLLYVGVKDTSYFYYSIYLFCTVVGWASVFAVLVKHFDVNEVGYALLPFYLGQMFSVLFYIRFLNLRPDKNPHLLRLSYGIVFVDLIYLGIFPWLDNYYVFYKSLMLISSIWLFVTLFAGFYRLYQGFVPARFFVLGFMMIAIGGSISILPSVGVEVGVESFYLVTLICQTLDMLFLAIGLADRINLLRSQKERAQRHASMKDKEILQVELQANHVLTDSNLKLKEALEISELEQRKKQNFLMLASHELKTPLNAMVQTSYEMDSKDENSRIIRQGVERLALVVDEVTLFSQLSSGGVKVVKNLMSVKATLEDLIAVQKTFRSNIKISTHGDLSDILLVDRYLLSILLKSIIDNACKYSTEGRVSISYEYDVERSAAQWVVEDDGQGIDLNEVEELMKPFEQQSQGYSREKEGMGLGLFVVVNVASTLGGDVSYGHSDDLGGTKITITVPAEKVEKKDSIERKEFNRALIVEDNPVNAAVLTSILTKLDMDSDLAVNGQEALDRVKDESYDIIFMDLQMPVMDGLEATRLLKEQAYPAPIVAVTADSESIAREHCFNLGMADVILKPVRVADIKECLEELATGIERVTD